VYNVENEQIDVKYITYRYDTLFKMFKWYGISEKLEIFKIYLVFNMS